MPCPLWIQFDQHFTRDTLLKEKWCIASCWLKTEDMKSIVSFIFSSSRLSTWAVFLSKSYKGIKQIYFQVYRICGEEMNRNYLDLQICVKWTEDENNLINIQYQWLHGIHSRIIYVFSLIFTKPVSTLLSIFLNTKKGHLNNYTFQVHYKIRKISAFKVWERIHYDYSCTREDSQHCKRQTILTYCYTQI